MGKGASKKSEDILSGSASSMTALMNELNAEGKGDRSTARDYYKGIIAGGPELDKAIAPQVADTKNYYKTAIEQAGRIAPRGGALDQTTSALLTSQASDLGRLRTGKVDDAVARIASQGVFGTGAGISAGGQSINAGDALGRLAVGQMGAISGGISGLGGAVGSYAGLKAGSSIDFKRDIEAFSDHDWALDVIAQTAIRRFRYKETYQPGDKLHIGFILEESNPIFTSEADKRQIDIPDVIGVLMSAIKALQAKIGRLEGGA